MACIKGVDGIKTLGTILSVWAHPDDETYIAGGIMAAAVRNGQKVACITATKGEAGLQDPTKWTLEGLGEVRAQELRAALDVLGIDQHHWLDYEDGCCEQANKNVAAKKLAKLVNKIKPDTILTFGKDGMTGHSDHCCVSCWVDDAVELAQVKPVIYHATHTTTQYENYLQHMDKELNIFFNIDDPPIIDESECDLYLELDEKLKTLKLKALSQMPSQTGIMLEKFDEAFLSDALASEAFVLKK